MCTEGTDILNPVYRHTGNGGQMWCQKLPEWSAVILSPSGDAFSFPKETQFSNRKDATQHAVD